ncbi:hypothetical protein HID58_014760 [Brassica napus]|uniref:Uncharacterized protein n=1 Tax=Brassica napus TaxID=3708 RepID=A0ABQ8DJX6_BRANA|nr:hypothetical protein HID58_014760 [Brassica napus]
MKRGAVIAVTRESRLCDTVEKSMIGSNKVERSSARSSVVSRFRRECMNWCRPDSFGLDRRLGTDHSTIIEWPAWADHSMIVEWFDSPITRRSSSGLLGSTTRRPWSCSMVGPLDNRRVAFLGRPMLGLLVDQRVACLGRPLDDRRAVCEFGMIAPSIFKTTGCFGVSDKSFQRTSAATAPMANAYANATDLEKIENLAATFCHRKCNETSSRFLFLNIKGNDKSYQTP